MEQGELFPDLFSEKTEDGKATRFVRTVIEGHRRVFGRLMRPVLALLTAIGVSPDLLSLAQVFCAAVGAYRLPLSPWTALGWYLGAIAFDALDGALARYQCRTSAWGKLWDRLCDYGRASLLMVGLCNAGLVSTTLGVFYVYTHGLYSTLHYLGRWDRIRVPFSFNPSFWLIVPLVGGVVGWRILVEPLVLLIALWTFGIVAAYLVQFRVHWGRSRLRSVGGEEDEHQ